MRVYSAALQARITLHQAGQLAALAEAAKCSEAEVVRYALEELFGSGDSDSLLEDLQLRLASADEELRYALEHGQVEDEPDRG